MPPVFLYMICVTNSLVCGKILISLIKNMDTVP